MEDPRLIQQKCGYNKTSKEKETDRKDLLGKIAHGQTNEKGWAKFTEQSGA